MILFLKFKEAWLWIFIWDQNSLPITDALCSINGYVAIGVTTHSLQLGPISPEPFSHVVGWVKLLLKKAVDCTERVGLEIRFMVYQCLQYIRIACVKKSILKNFIDLTCWAVFWSNKINCKIWEPVKRLCFIFNGSLWIVEKCWSWIWKPKWFLKVLFLFFCIASKFKTMKLMKPTSVTKVQSSKVMPNKVSFLKVLSCK